MAKRVDCPDCLFSVQEVHVTVSALPRMEVWIVWEGWASELAQPAEDTISQLDFIPKSMVVQGGGIIGRRYTNWTLTTGFELHEHWF